MPDEKKIENLRTLQEAAEYMKLKPRTLAKAAKKIGACSVFGRDIYLSEDDVRSVWEAHRASPTNGRIITAYKSEHAVYENLKRLTAKPIAKRKPKERT